VVVVVGLEELVGALRSGRPQGRRRAARALGAQGDRRAVPALIAALEDADPGVRYEAVLALDVLNDPAALPSLIRVGRSDPAVDVREAALRVIPGMAW
jgi:HEAT repeat protein